MLHEDHPRPRGSGETLEDVWAPRMVLCITSSGHMQYSHFGQEKKIIKNTSGLLPSVLASSWGRFGPTRNLEGPTCCGASDADCCQESRLVPLGCSFLRSIAAEQAIYDAGSWWNTALRPR